jgi:PPOX class probable F420-dependent enzyme
MQHDTAPPTRSHAPLAAERYISLTTFTRNGTPKSTPVWPVDAGDGRIGFVTSSKTWKVKRITADSRIAVQPSDAKGRVREGSHAVSGRAEVKLGERFEAINRKVKAKYGYQLRLINMLHALPGRSTGHRNDCAVIVSLDAS